MGYILNIPDNPRKVIPKGQKIFIYDHKIDNFISETEYRLKDPIEKDLLIIFPSLNRTNAIKKLKKFFKTNLT